jgi:hypothetical protein
MKKFEQPAIDQIVVARMRLKYRTVTGLPPAVWSLRQALGGLSTALEHGENEDGIMSVSMQPDRSFTVSTHHPLFAGDQPINPPSPDHLRIDEFGRFLSVAPDNTVQEARISSPNISRGVQHVGITMIVGFVNNLREEAETRSHPLHFFNS